MAEDVIRCMLCSVKVVSLKEARRRCPRIPLEARDRSHVLSIGDEIKLGRVFPRSKLRAMLGTEFESTVAANPGCVKTRGKRRVGS